MSNNLKSPPLSKSGSYPTGKKRVELETRIIATVISKMSYLEVQWLKALDFENEDNRKAWIIIENTKGNYKEMIRKDVFTVSRFVPEVDHFNAKPVALLLVECNIHKAIVNELEKLAYDSKEEIKSQFFMNTAQQALKQDALKLHAGILSYVKPMASTNEYQRLEKLVKRISNRIADIKKQWI